MTCIKAMKEILFLSLIFLLELSIAIHIRYMVGYVSSKSNSHFRGFIVTTFTNIVCAMVMTVIVFNNPGVIGRLNIDLFFILEGGFVFIVLLLIKIRIGIQIIRRTRDPEYYHLNYFGKKIYEGPVVKKGELAFYFLSMPFTLIAGAFFVTKLISFFS